MSQPAKIHVDGAAGIAYLTNYNLGSVQAWNYSSGVLVNEFQVNTAPWGLTRLNNGNFVVVNGGTATTYNSNFIFLSSFLVGSSYGVGTDGTNIFIGDAGTVRKFNTTGTLLGTVTTPGRNIYEIKIRGNEAFVGGVAMAGRFGRFNISSMSGYTETLLGGTTATSAVEGLAFGHGVNMYAATTSSTTGNPQQLVRHHLGTNSTISYFGTNVTMGRITGLATIVAPEPASASFMALALGALLLRRKRA